MTNTEHRIKMTANGMVALEGSPKQIAWAEKIRATFFEIVEENWEFAMEAIEREESCGNSAEEIKAEVKIADLVERYLLTKVSSASWWIDNRSYLTNCMVVDAELASLYKSRKEEIEAMNEEEEENETEETSEEIEETEEESTLAVSDSLSAEESHEDEPITIELPELVGSPKQIALATEIRNRFAREASYLIRYNDERKSDPTGYFRKAFVKVFAIKDCFSWIERQNLSIHDWIDITKNNF